MPLQVPAKRSKCEVGKAETSAGPVVKANATEQAPLPPTISDSIRPLDRENVDEPSAEFFPGREAEPVAPSGNITVAVDQGLDEVSVGDVHVSYFGPYQINRPNFYHIGSVMSAVSRQVVRACFSDRAAGSSSPQN